MSKVGIGPQHLGQVLWDLAYPPAGLNGMSSVLTGEFRSALKVAIRME